MTCILSDDTHVFVLLLYWVNRADMQCKVQLERWDGPVLKTNVTLLAATRHAYTRDTTSYPYGKGNDTALNII